MIDLPSRSPAGRIGVAAGVHERRDVRFALAAGYRMDDVTWMLHLEDRSASRLGPAETLGVGTAAGPDSKRPSKT